MIIWWSMEKNFGSTTWPVGRTDPSALEYHSIQRNNFHCTWIHCLLRVISLADWLGCLARFFLDHTILPSLKYLEKKKKFDLILFQGYIWFTKMHCVMNILIDQFQFSSPKLHSVLFDCSKLDSLLKNIQLANTINSNLNVIFLCIQIWISHYARGKISTHPFLFLTPF